MEQLISKASNLEEVKQCVHHGEYPSKGKEINFGDGRSRVIWTGCAKCEAEEKAAEEKRQAEFKIVNEKHRWDELLGRSGLPRRFVGKSFDSFNATTVEQKQALGAAKEYANNFQTHVNNGTGLIFLGGIGVGKSHLAAAIIQTIMPEYFGLYVTVSDCIRAVRDTWKKGAGHSETHVLNQFIYADLLVLDEVGKQYGTDGEQNVIFDVLDGRYREMMPTILLGNISAEKKIRNGHEKKLNDIEFFLGERVADRMRETNTAIAFDWESYRAIAKKEVLA